MNTNFNKCVETAVLGCIGLYWAILGCTGLYWDVMGWTEAGIELVPFYLFGAILFIFGATFH